MVVVVLLFNDRVVEIGVVVVLGVVVVDVLVVDLDVTVVAIVVVVVDEGFTSFSTDVVDFLSLFFFEADNLPFLYLFPVNLLM